MKPFGLMFTKKNHAFACAPICDEQNNDDRDRYLLKLENSHLDFKYYLLLPFKLCQPIHFENKSNMFKCVTATKNVWTIYNFLRDFDIIFLN